MAMSYAFEADCKDAGKYEQMAIDLRAAARPSLFRETRIHNGLADSCAFRLLGVVRVYAGSGGARFKPCIVRD
jgi:hypothetical protein